MMKSRPQPLLCVMDGCIQMVHCKYLCKPHYNGFYREANYGKIKEQTSTPEARALKNKAKRLKRKNNPELYKVLDITPLRRYYAGKCRAIARGLLWDIPQTVYYDMLKLSCDYCKGDLPKSGCGLDRKDNNLGYTISNSVPCCTRCNVVKNKWLTYDEMKLVAQLLWLSQVKKEEDLCEQDTK